MTKAPPSDGQAATEKHSGGEKCFPQVRCTQEHGSADGKTEAVLAEHVRRWRLMGEGQARNVERPERGLGLGLQERRRVQTRARHCLRCCWAQEGAETRRRKRLRW